MPAQDASTHVMGVARFERFFRASAGLDVDKNDIRRFDDFVNTRIHGLLLRVQATARANIRDVIEPHDLPITKGLQEPIAEFRRMDEEIALQPILDHLTILPPLDLACSPETEGELPAIAGGLGVALAQTLRIIDPDLRNPQTSQWDRAIRVFAPLL